MAVVDVGPGLGTSTWRAVLGLLPRGPLARRRGDTLPDVTLVRRAAGIDRDHLAAYDRVCGFRLSDELPATYPHVLAFPLAMHLLTAPDFPFPAVGLVHIANRIAVRRPLTADMSLDLTVHAADLRAHERGRQVDIVATATVDNEPVWTSVSTYLSRSSTAAAARSSDSSAARSPDSAVSPATASAGARPSDPAASRSTGPGALSTAGAAGSTSAAVAPSTGAAVAPSAEAATAGYRGQRAGLTPTAVWRVPARVGTDYAALSGDRNPIHTSRVGARLFGFPRPIAHGMWSVARCLAALEGRLPDRYTVDVRFRQPIMLPATVSFAYADGGFELSGRKPHLAGQVTPA